MLIKTPDVIRINPRSTISNIDYDRLITCLQYPETASYYHGDMQLDIINCVEHCQSNPNPDDISSDVLSQFPNEDEMVSISGIAYGYEKAKKDELKRIIYRMLEALEEKNSEFLNAKEYVKDLLK